MVRARIPAASAVIAVAIVLTPMSPAHAAVEAGVHVAIVEAGGLPERAWPIPAEALRRRVLEAGEASAVGDGAPARAGLAARRAWLRAAGARLAGTWVDSADLRWAGDRGIEVRLSFRRPRFWWRPRADRAQAALVEDLGVVFDPADGARPDLPWAVGALSAEERADVARFVRAWDAHPIGRRAQLSEIRRVGDELWRIWLVGVASDRAPRVVDFPRLPGQAGSAPGFQDAVAVLSKLERVLARAPARGRQISALSPEKWVVRTLPGS